MADAARNVAQKKHAADQMCQSEQQHVDDLENFNRFYLTPIKHWIHDPTNADMFVKYPGLCSKPALENWFYHINEMIKVHHEFSEELKER